MVLGLISIIVYICDIICVFRGRGGNEERFRKYRTGIGGNLMFIGCEVILGVKEGI